MRSLALVFGLSGEALDVERAAREYVRPGHLSEPDDLLRVARAHGYKAKLCRSSVKRIGALSLPFIARRPDGNFFVIGRRCDGGVFVGEDGSGPTHWSLEQLAKNWTGEVLFAVRRDRSGSDAVKFGLAWFLPVIRRFRKVLAEILVFSIFIQLLALVAPLFTQVVIDKVLVHRGLTTLQVLVVGLLAVNFADATLNWLRTYVFAHTTSRMDAVLRAQLFRHLVALPIGYFESRATGQTVARVHELKNVRNFITSSALTLVIDVVFGLAFLGVMTWYSTTLTLVVAASIPVYAVISLSMTPVLKARVQEKFQRGAANQSMLVESLGGIQTLKAMAVEPQVRARYEEQLAGYIGAALRCVTLGAAGSHLVGLTGKLTSAALLWFGAQAVIGGSLTIGEFVAFNMLAGQISGPVLRLAQLWQDFQQFRLSIDRLGDILNTPVEPGSEGIKQCPPPLRGHIRFERVGFRYRPGGPEILRGLDVEIRPGEVVGIVGRSGSGKSTLTKLLQRLYLSERGRVLVDGIDVGLLDPSWLRRQIGVVPQENVLFARTIRENIALADPAAPLEPVIRAAQLAGAHEFITELPQGYDTVLEERGANLSGGQRQRIAIARALMTNPRVLIFDEATSALDYESERIIQANMRSICQNRTVLIEAHRLSTVRGANRILVMDKGELAEAGTHEALVQQGGIYAGLVRQAAG
ncbi:type I secretion system permease/ATPase [Methylobacterium persicinum]|uniref:Subfamily B ATP-binding cassette protein HlyB/CyaB n=1 Tax=Methylobacterium persicinum TaxID=374426 RepID=A0ABU0HPL5_9HYPH|nr:type I secretion system permease/ATPase [Methylobacterium persicinum]MDQ0444258.1 subfamily B ATP-binding cassette protein HlyB/CyaB [Methylobacterium persicinum]GJE39644.1 Leukotoxin export ATP-binding protein LtxB [Methylobacterium persicinum]